MIWYLSAAAALAVLAVVFDQWLYGAFLAAVGLVRKPQPPGSHRPESLELVDDDHLITYPGLYERYLPFVELYGYGAEQAAYWCWRKARIAELREAAELRRAQREMEADYGWLELDATQPRELEGATR